ncbi:putative inactive serine/threonine-protein kinase scy1, partial [Cucurbita argyrosperma subsp. argyrosperma]
MSKEKAIITLLQGCNSLNKLRKIHAHVLVSGLRHHVAINNKLLNFCAISVSGSLAYAQLLFHQMECLQTEAWNSIIRGFAQSSSPIDAVVYYNQMVCASFSSPDTFTFSFVLKACERLKAERKCKEIHGTIIRCGYDGDVIICTNLVKCYAAMGSVCIAQQVFDEMPVRDLVAWNAMISCFSQQGLHGEALQVYNQMRSENVDVDGHQGLVQEGVKYFNLMSSKFRLRPEVKHYGCLVDLYGRAGKLEKALETIRNSSPNDPVLWRILLGSCKIHKNVSVGEIAMNNLNELGATNAGDCILLATIYAGVNDTAGVASMRKTIKSQGIKTSPGWSWIEIGEQVHKFVVDDKSHRDSIEVYEKLREVLHQASLFGYVRDAETLKTSSTYHSEKLAIAFGLARTADGTPIRIVKNLRVCRDCHSFMKAVSVAFDREIIVRDRVRFHHFKGGQCSCNDYCTFEALREKLFWQFLKFSTGRKSATETDGSGGNFVLFVFGGGGGERRESKMFKFLKGVVGGSGSGLKDLPYNIGDPYPSAWGSWTHFRGTIKDDGSPVSIFSLSGSDAQDGHLAAGRNGVRHPNILSFLHSTEAETIDGSASKITIYIVTEPVMPLSEKIKELGLEGTQRDEYYAWGLHQIAKAVSFLNNDCKLVHGNVCLASVVVTPTLDWKLHAFDVLSEFDGNNESSSGQMLQYAWLIGSQYKPMELVKSDLSVIRKSPPWAVDSWGLGCLIYELFSGLKLGKTEELRNTASIPKSLLPDYQRLLSSMPSRRLNTSKLIENSEYFQNKLVDTIHFMEILSLKDSVEKDTFFRKLPILAEQLPRQIVLKKLLPLLASALEFGSATAPALTALLKMGSWLSTEEFNAKVLPTIVKLFASNDRAIRTGLLQHIDQFGESLSSQMVDEQVYPHVANGFNDTSAFLRELTLKSMLVLAPKLSQRTISGSLLKYLSKLQVDEEAAIRTNTTILLGNIASYLNEGTRKRVLINAFTVRALRDTFSPARGAGIMALCATSGYYDSAEIATRILPNVIVLTVDPDSDVRLKSFQAVDQFLQILKQNNEEMSGDTAALGLNIPSLPGNASLLGWAMSSLTLKGKPSEHGSSAPVSSNAPLAATSSDSTLEVENGIHDEDENEKDGWDELEPLEESKPSPALANIQAAQKRPVSQIVSQTKRPSSSSGSRSTPRPAKEDDDLWGSIAAPAPRTGSKSLKVKASTTIDDDDPWAAIAAPAPTTRAKPLSAGRGRGNKPAAPKLGAQRINRTSSTGM